MTRDELLALTRKADRPRRGVVDRGIPRGWMIGCRREDEGWTIWYEGKIVKMRVPSMGQALDYVHKEHER